MTTEEAEVAAPKPGFGWARDLVDQQAWVLHATTRSVSRVKAFWDGVDAVYVSTTNNLPVKGPVLELDDGNAFVAVEEVFHPLTQEEVDFYMHAQREVGRVTKECAVLGASGGMRKETSMLLIGVALRATARVTDLVSQMRKPSAKVEEKES